MPYPPRPPPRPPPVPLRDALREVSVGPVRLRGAPEDGLLGPTGGLGPQRPPPGVPRVQPLSTNFRRGKGHRVPRPPHPGGKDVSGPLPDLPRRRITTPREPPRQRGLGGRYRGRRGETTDSESSTDCNKTHHLFGTQDLRLPDLEPRVESVTDRHTDQTSERLGVKDVDSSPPLCGINDRRNAPWFVFDGVSFTVSVVKGREGNINSVLFILKATLPTREVHLLGRDCFRTVVLLSTTVTLAPEALGSPSYWSANQVTFPNDASKPLS